MKSVYFECESRESGEFTLQVWYKAVHILQSAVLGRVTAEVSSVYLYKEHKLNKTDKLRLGP
jgi:hypothetical protein